MATTLGSLILELGLDDTKFTKQLADIQKLASRAGKDIEGNLKGITSKTKLETLKPTVDHKPLSELNKHIERKREHVEEVNAWFNNNPLTPKVDDRFLDELNTKLDNIESKDIKIAVDETSLDNLKREVQINSQKTNTDLGVELSDLSNTIKELNLTMEGVVRQGGINLKQKDVKDIPQVAYDRRSGNYRWTTGQDRGKFVSRDDLAKLRESQGLWVPRARTDRQIQYSERNARKFNAILEAAFAPGTVEELTSEMGSAVAENVESGVREGIRPTLIRRTFGVLGFVVKGVLEGAFSSLGEYAFSRIMGDRIPKQVVELSKDSLKPLTDQLNNVFTKIEQGIIGFGDTLADQISEGVSDALEPSTFSKILNVVTGGLSGSFSDIIEGLYEEIGAGFGKEIGSGLVKSFESTFDINLNEFGNKKGKRVFPVIKEVYRRNDAIRDLGGDVVDILGERLKLAGFRVGDGIAASLKEENLINKINALFSNIDLSGFKEVLNDMREDFSEAGVSFSENFSLDMSELKLLDKILVDLRQVGLRERAIPLVKQRVAELTDPNYPKNEESTWKKNRRGNAIKAIDENTEELFIVTGGIAGAEGKSARRLVSGKEKIDLPYPERQKIIAVDNTDMDAENLGAFGGMLLPYLSGFSNDAIEMAAQALSAIQINPEIKIKLIGESGGGAIAEEAYQILKMMGVSSEYVGVGTPNIVGALGEGGKGRFSSKDDFVTNINNKKFGALMKDPTFRQKGRGAVDHNISSYLNENVAELRQILDPIEMESKDKIDEAIKQSQTLIQNISSTNSDIIDDLIDVESQLDKKFKEYPGLESRLNVIKNEYNRVIKFMDAVGNPDDLEAQGHISEDEASQFRSMIVETVNAYEDLLDEYGLTELVPKREAAIESHKTAIKATMEALQLVRQQVLASVGDESKSFNVLAEQLDRMYVEVKGLDKDTINLAKELSDIEQFIEYVNKSGISNISLAAIPEVEDKIKSIVDRAKTLKKAPQTEFDKEGILQYRPENTNTKVDFLETLIQRSRQNLNIVRDPRFGIRSVSENEDVTDETKDNVEIPFISKPIVTELRDGLVGVGAKIGEEFVDVVKKGLAELPVPSNLKIAGQRDLENLDLPQIREMVQKLEGGIRAAKERMTVQPVPESFVKQMNTDFVALESQLRDLLKVIPASDRTITEEGNLISSLLGRLTKVETALEQLTSAYKATTIPPPTPEKALDQIRSLFVNQSKLAKTSTVPQEKIDLAKGIVLSASKAKDTIDNMLVQYGDSIPEPVAKKASTTKGVITKKEKEARKLLESLNVDMSTVGNDVVEGLTAPINKALSDIENVGKSIGKAVTEGAEDELDISSPSKVFIRIGEQIQEGLAIGLERSGRSDSVIEDITDSLESKILALKDIVKDKKEFGLTFDEAFSGEAGKPMLGLLTQAVTQGKLPEKSEIRKALLEATAAMSREGRFDPVKTVQAGLARQEFASGVLGRLQGEENLSTAQITGRGLRKALGMESVQDLIGEAAVNTTGLLGSIAGGTLGPVGALVGDAGGALLMRKLTTDLSATLEAMETNEVNDISAVLKVLEDARRIQQNKSGKIKENFAGDMVGFTIGNTVAQMSPLNVPLQGAMAAMYSTPEVVNEGKNIITGEKNPTESVRDLGVRLTTKWYEALQKRIKTLRLMNQAEESFIDETNEKLYEITNSYKTYMVKFLAQIVSRETLKMASGETSDPTSSTNKAPISKMMDTRSKLINVKNAVDIASNTKDIGSTIIGSFDSIFGEGQFAETAKKDSKAVFDSISEGLVSALEDTGEVKEKAEKLAQAVIDAAKETLGISSPSKEFEYIAQMCIEGFNKASGEFKASKLGAKLLESLDVITNDALNKVNEASIEIISFSRSQLEDASSELERLLKESQSTLANVSGEGAIGSSEKLSGLAGKLSEFRETNFNADDDAGEWEKNIANSLDEIIGKLNEASAATRMFGVAMSDLSNNEEPFEDIRDSVDQTETTTKKSSGLFDSLTEKFGSLENAAVAVVKGIAGFFSLATLGPMLLDFADSAMASARAFQSTEISLGFLEGSAGAAQEKIKQIRRESDAMGISAKQSIKAYLQLSASTKGTSLEGVATDQILAGVSAASSAYGLDSQSAERVGTAISQMAAKGVISMEELRQQLGEALPGAFQTAARAMGVTTQELVKMVEKGQLLSEDFLPKFAQQLSAESSIGVASAANSATASINRLNNAVDELQVGIGKNLLPLDKIKTDVLTLGVKAILELLPFLGAIATVVAIQIVKAFVDVGKVLTVVKGQFVSLGTQIQILTAQGTITAIKGMAKAFLSLTAVLRSLLVQFVVIQAAITAASIAFRYFGDNSGTIGDITKDSTRQLELMKEKLNEVEGSAKKAADSLENVKLREGAGSFLEEGLIGSLNKNVKERRQSNNPLNNAINWVSDSPFVAMNALSTKLKEKQQTDLRKNIDIQSSNADEVIANADRYLTGDKTSLIADFNEIEEKLKSVQREQQLVKIINPDDVEALKKLAETEDSLLESRSEAQKGVAIARKSIDDELKRRKDALEALKEDYEAGVVAPDVYEYGTKELTDSIKQLEEKQNAFNKAIDNTIIKFNRLRSEADKMRASTIDASFFAGIESNQRLTEVSRMDTGLNTGIVQGTSEVINQQQLMSVLTANQIELQGLISQTNDRDMAAILQQLADKIPNLENLGPERLTLERTKLEDAQADPILIQGLDTLIGIENINATIADVQNQLTTSQARFQGQINQLGRQLEDMLIEVGQQTEEIAHSFKEFENDRKVANASNTITRTMGKLRTDHFSGMMNILERFINVIGEQLKSTSDFLKQKMDVMNQLFNTLRQNEQFALSIPQIDQGIIGSQGTNGRNVASPLMGQSIESLVSYKPTEGQSFRAGRTRNGQQGYHSGIDWDSRVGGGRGADVAAPFSGTARVIDIAEQEGDRGNAVQVRITTQDAKGIPIDLQFNHLELESVKKALGIGIGESTNVSMGQLVGEVIQHHLDMKVKVNGEFVDAQQWLAAMNAGGGVARNLQGVNVNINPISQPASRTAQSTPQQSGIEMFRNYGQVASGVARTGFGSRGISTTGLTVKGQEITDSQFQYARTIARVGQQLGATADEIRVAISTAIQESTLRNLGGGDRDSLGLFQQRPSMEWGSREQISNPEFAARSFFQGIGSNRGLLSTRGATNDLYARSHMVQRSAHPNAPRQWNAEARKLTEAAMAANTTPTMTSGSATTLNVSGYTQSSNQLLSENQKYVDMLQQNANDQIKLIEQMKALAEERFDAQIDSIFSESEREELTARRATEDAARQRDREQRDRAYQNIPDFRMTPEIQLEYDLDMASRDIEDRRIELQRQIEDAQNDINAVTQLLETMPNQLLAAGAKKEDVQRIENSFREIISQKKPLIDILKNNLADLTAMEGEALLKISEEYKMEEERRYMEFINQLNELTGENLRQQAEMLRNQGNPEIAAELEKQADAADIVQKEKEFQFGLKEQLNAGLDRDRYDQLLAESIKRQILALEILGYNIDRNTEQLRLNNSSFLLEQRAANVEALTPLLNRTGEAGNARDLSYEIEALKIQQDLESQIFDLYEGSKGLTDETRERSRLLIEETAQLKLQTLELEQALQVRADQIEQSRNPLVGPGGVTDLMGAQDAYLGAFGASPTEAMKQERLPFLLDMQRLDYQNAILELEKLKNAGKLTDEGFKAMSESLSKINDIKMDQIRQEASMLPDVIKNVRGPVQGLFSDLMKGTKTVGEAFNDFVNGLIDNLMNLAAEMLTNNLFAGIFGGAAGISSDTGNGIIEMLFGTSRSRSPEEDPNVLMKPPIYNPLLQGAMDYSSYLFPSTGEIRDPSLTEYGKSLFGASTEDTTLTTGAEQASASLRLGGEMVLSSLQLGAQAIQQAAISTQAPNTLDTISGGLFDLSGFDLTFENGAQSIQSAIEAGADRGGAQLGSIVMDVFSGSSSTAVSKGGFSVGGVFQSLLSTVLGMFFKDGGVIKTNTGLGIENFAKGGVIGRSQSTLDKLASTEAIGQALKREGNPRARLAVVSPGEWVLNRQQQAIAKRYGVDENVLNFKNGGVVGGSFSTPAIKAPSGGGTSVTVPITINSDGNNPEKDNRAAKDLSQKVRAAVFQVLTEQKRPNGLLY
jgi:tape measure domain-containing protein